MIPLFKVYWEEEDVEAVANVIRSGMNWATGKEIEIFERMLADYIGVKHCITFNSGTSALHSVLLAYGIGKGDEVIVPSFTFIATANAVKMVGATPIFADIEEERLGLDPADVAAKITRRTKAIMPVHYAGAPCRIEELKEMAAQHHLLLIEDACEALGATSDGRKAGSFGDAGVLSFCQNKIISTGEGGAAVTDSDEICARLKLLRSHGREEGDHFSTNLDYISLGYNFRLSTMQAALGISQLRKIDKLIDMRRGIAYFYNMSSLPCEGNVFQMYSVRFAHRDEIVKKLTENGIASKVFFNPVHRTKFYNEVLSLPVTMRISSEILSLPIYPGLAENDCLRVRNIIHKGALVHA